MNVTRVASMPCLKFMIQLMGYEGFDIVNYLLTVM